jgi:hypothetical protein
VWRREDCHEPEEARHAALRAFGNPTVLTEDNRRSEPCPEAIAAALAGGAYLCSYDDLTERQVPGWSSRRFSYGIHLIKRRIWISDNYRDFNTPPNPERDGSNRALHFLPF